MAKDRPRDANDRRRGLSRRDFLRGGAAGALAGGLLPGALRGRDDGAPQPASSTDGFVGPGPVAVRLTINGRHHDLSLEPRVTLLDALRDRLGVTGAKRVCDRGTCGACTVLLDGRTVYACSVLAIEAQGLAIETVESLGTPENLHPVQAAFIENDAQQCGFCTPGFVVATAALLRDNPNPTEEEAAHALGGNFCRCGTYAGIRKVVGTGGEGGGRG
jgi:xanthine dehydrogenase YagT iron-sulfur-binding subunit